MNNISLNYDKIYLIVLFVLLFTSISLLLFLPDKNCVVYNSFRNHNDKILVLHVSGSLFSSPDISLENYLYSITEKREYISQYDVIKLDPLLRGEENGTKDWTIIAHNIAKNYDLYDAFIILHQASTMAYTASALSFMLENLDKPVILTSSTYLADDAVTDAKNNILNSLNLASNYRIPEVMICYGNKIFRGNRATFVSANDTRSFASPNHPLIGRVSGEQLELNEKNILARPDKPFNFIPCNTLVKVIGIKIYPDMEENDLRIPDYVTGVVIEPFGYSEVNSQIYKLLREKLQRGTVILSVSQALTHVNPGKSSGMPEGVIDCKDMTMECAFAKLVFLLSNVQKEEWDLFPKLCVMSLRGEIG